MPGWEAADAAMMDAIQSSGAFLVGLTGAQGSGKSTTAARLAGALGERGRRVAVLSLDDFYLTRDEREALATRVHPLLRVRGVPGTHDVRLAIDTINGLAGAGPGQGIRLPRFDKANDDRAPESSWPVVTGRPNLIILEGWCVCATPQSDTDLAAPVNALEAEEDADGRWRGYVNDRLKDEYAALFAMLDYRIFLQASAFRQVLGWRAEQEAALARSTRGSAIMDWEALARFIAHYERITRHVLANPSADLVVRLGADRTPLAIEKA